MSTSAEAPLSSSNDERSTIVSIAVLAFVLADIGHEVLGHGLGFVLAGGRSGIFTTTRLIETERLGNFGWRIFDVGGPFGNLVFAGLPWVAQRLFSRGAPHLRLFLVLLMAFSLFWAFGYLMFCGVLARGDWFALIRDVRYDGLWRMLFVVAGLVLYRLSMRVVAAEFHWVFSGKDALWRLRVRRCVLLSYVAGGLISCAGAALDPRGYMEILNSGALAGFAAAVGLLWVPALFAVSGEDRATVGSAITGSFRWISGAITVSVFYIAVLGPGIRFAF